MCVVFSQIHGIVANYAELLSSQWDQSGKARYYFEKALKIEPRNSALNYKFGYFLHKKLKLFTSARQ